jgi:antirestriction protein ArdC
VMKGERGTMVVYADRFIPDDERRRAAEAGEEPSVIPFLKRFSVFNTDQCDGLSEKVAVSVVAPPPDQIEPQAEALIVATGADFRRDFSQQFSRGSLCLVGVKMMRHDRLPIRDARPRRVRFEELDHRPRMLRQ